MARQRGLASWMHRQESQWRALAARHVLLRRAPAGRRMLDAIMFTMPSAEDVSPLAWQPSVIDEGEPIAPAPTSHAEGVRAEPRRPVAPVDTRPPERALARSGPTTPQEAEVERVLGKPVAPVGPPANAGIRFAHDPVVVPPPRAPSVHDTPETPAPSRRNAAPAAPAAPAGPTIRVAAPQVVDDAVRAAPAAPSMPRAVNDTAPGGATPASPVADPAVGPLRVAPSTPRAVNDAAPVGAPPVSPPVADAAIGATPASPVIHTANETAPPEIIATTTPPEAIPTRAPQESGAELSTGAVPARMAPAGVVDDDLALRREAGDTEAASLPPLQPQTHDAATVAPVATTRTARIPPPVATSTATGGATPPPTADAVAGDETAPLTVDSRTADVSAVDTSRAALASATPPAPDAVRAASPAPAMLNATETVAGAPSPPPREPSVQSHGDAKSSAELVTPPPLPAVPPPAVPHPLGKQSMPIAEERRARREMGPRARPDVVEASRQVRTDRTVDAQGASPAPSPAPDDALFAQAGRSPDDWLARLRATVAHERAPTAGPSGAPPPAHSTLATPPATPNASPPRSARAIVRRAAAEAVRGPARTGSTTARGSHGENGRAPRGDSGIGRS